MIMDATSWPTRLQRTEVTMRNAYAKPKRKYSHPRTGLIQLGDAFPLLLARLAAAGAKSNGLPPRAGGDRRDSPLPVQHTFRWYQ